jgi:5'-nucleotidase
MSRLTAQLVVAISSRALFDFEEENALFDPHDDGPYIQLQLARLEQLAKPGIAFRLVKKLLGFNADGVKRVEVVILSRNDPVSGLRVLKSVQGHGLAIERAVFTRGREPWGYVRALKANLFLSANAEDVRNALHEQFPAAVVYTSTALEDSHPDEVRIAFDGDAVLFADESERVYQAEGLDAFQRHERDHATRPLQPGPFKSLLEALQRL